MKKVTQLGITFNEKLTDDHIDTRINKAMTGIHALKRLSNILPRSGKRSVYLSFIRPILEYGNQLYDNCSETLSKRLEKVQREAALCITRAYRCTKHNNLLAEVGLTTLKERRRRQKLLFIYKCLNNLAPDYLASVITTRKLPIQHETRHPNDLLPYNSNKCYLYNSFIVSSIREWNLEKKTLEGFSIVKHFQKSLTS